MSTSTRIRRAVVPAAFGVLMSGAFVLGAGAPATAGALGRPADCHYERMRDWGGAAECRDHNGGSYRGLVLCRYPNGRIVEFVGPWRQNGISYAYCQNESKAQSAGVETSVYDKT
ncbi:hypothetical protein ABZO31_00555 [Streptomyces sp. HUAS MG47]|uniref:hypothetical protein n=1 Tax=Streptomyces solicamelliae TaxID=3231716 RepID=UPI003877D523